MVSIICTLGPGCDSRETLQEMKSRGMSFARVNLSHVGLDYVKKVAPLCKELAIPLIMDTEGAQVRTGRLKKSVIFLDEGKMISLHNEPIEGDEDNIHLWPVGVVKSLKPGDMVSIDFDSLLLTVTDISCIAEGRVIAKVVNGGLMGKNKSVVITDSDGNKMELPALSDKDKDVLNYSMLNGIGYVAASFMDSVEFVDEVRDFVGGKMKIISKIESKKALSNLEPILKKSDFALIDRGDLSKEISIERIPLTQKVILKTGLRLGVPVFVATNLLESMSENRTPTRAEVNDIMTALLDGAGGLVLAGETAVGKHPVECVRILDRLVKQSDQVVDFGAISDDKVVERLNALNYLTGGGKSSLVEPHGGRLVNRMLKTPLEKGYIDGLYRLRVDKNTQMDLEQIAIGTFSPLEGFMCKDDFRSVLDNMRLKSGIAWPIPIVLDIDEKTRCGIGGSKQVCLASSDGDPIAILDVEEIYSYDRYTFIEKMYGTDSEQHPGVNAINNMKPYLVGGRITLLKRAESKFKEYELTPAQARKIFEEKGWSRVVGFHTRNVIHKSHEFIQMDALSRCNCDGLFVHPVIGKKKPGDFNSEYIIRSYEMMINRFYPKGKVVFGAFATFSRYAGPREALFTALCRKNFGCSHFIVGRDHTGVKDFYSPTASHEIFDRFLDLGIVPVKYNSIFYSKQQGRHIHEPESPEHPVSDRLDISGTEARAMFERGETPPSWFMRPEISQMISDSIKNGEEVFVKEQKRQAKVLWFTGLSGSGKTTIADALKAQLELDGKSVLILDGDVVRSTMHVSLGFSREDIRTNNRLIAELCVKKGQEFDYILVPVISPYREDRAMARSIVGEGFFEIYISTPLHECIRRDVKGLYKKAIAGEITNMIGVHDSNPYEPPESPDLEIDTYNQDLQATVSSLIDNLKFGLAKTI